MRTVDGPSIDVLDGDSEGHEIQLSYQHAKAQIWVDNTAGTQSTAVLAADIPDDIDRMQYGYIAIADERFYPEPEWRAI